MYHNRESLQYTLRLLTLSWNASEHELVNTSIAIHRMAVSDHRMQRARFVARSATVAVMTRAAAAIAALLFAGCDRTSSSSEPLTLRYAAVTERASNGTNDNFFNIVEDDALFVLADTAVASPAADPAKQAAEGMSAAYRGCAGDRSRLACAVQRVSDTLAGARAGTTALAAAALENGELVVAANGDAVVVRIRDAEGEVPAATPEPVCAPGARVTERRLTPRSGDTLALLDRDLFAALGTAAVVRLAGGPFVDTQSVDRAAHAMIDAAKSHDHGPLTVVLVHFVRK